VAVVGREGNGKTVGGGSSSRRWGQSRGNGEEVWLGGEQGASGLLGFWEERGGSGVGRRVVTVAVTFRKF